MNILEWAAALDKWVSLAVLLSLVNIWSAGMLLAARAPRRDTVLWLLMLFLCPIVGTIFWFVLGPKRSWWGAMFQEGRK